MNLKIEMIVRNEKDEIVSKATSLSFESAVSDLGRMERYLEKKKI